MESNPFLQPNVTASENSSRRHAPHPSAGLNFLGVFHRFIAEKTSNMWFFAQSASATAPNLSRQIHECWITSRRGDRELHHLRAHLDFEELVTISISGWEPIPRCHRSSQLIVPITKMRGATLPRREIVSISTRGSQSGSTQQLQGDRPLLAGVHRD